MARRKKLPGNLRGRIRAEAEKLANSQIGENARQKILDQLQTRIDKMTGNPGSVRVIRTKMS